MIIIRQRTAARFFILLTSTCVFISLQACATPKAILQSYTKTYVKKDMSNMSMLSPLKVVRYQTPDIEVITLGRALTVATAATVVGAGAGAAIAGGMVGAQAGAAVSGGGGGVLAGLMTGQVKKQESFPDTGELVVRKFVERVKREVPGWPTTQVESQPVSKGYTYTSGSLLEFLVVHNLQSFDGYCCHITVTMKDSTGTTVWKRRFAYASSLYDRAKAPKEYLADNFKLLKEEIEFVTDTAVSDFIADLNRTP